MAKKRKVGARTQDGPAETELDPRDARKRIRFYEDVADSDDEFHLNNDEIRLGEDPEAKRRRQREEQEAFLQVSDEEVLGSSEGEDENSDLEDGQHAAQAKSRFEDVSEEEDETRGRYDDGEEELRWGTTGADIYGADAIETEEQALEEEAEALRLQKKQLETMQAADYGFDEDSWQRNHVPADVDKDDLNSVVTELLPQLQIAPDLRPAERLKLLKSRYPEFDLLSRDLLDLRNTHSELLIGSESSSVARIKLRAASAYIGALTMYFSLFTSTALSGKDAATAMSAAQLRHHPVMDSLVKCRELWRNVEQLSDTMPLIIGNSESSDPDLDHHPVDASKEEALAIETQPSRKKSRAERFAEAAQAAHEERRAERLKQTEADLAELDKLLASPLKRKATKSRAADMANGDDSDLGEQAPLTAREAEDKAKQKKSLRFYTSQIAQKANKRGTAGRNAGGDDDIPHRERLRDKQARLNAEAEKRGKHSADIGDNLGSEIDDEDRYQAQQMRADEEDDYYDLVAARASKKKSDKAALADAQQQAALQNGRVVQEESVGADGKRKISYAIEKNKGLTPHRKKDVRNPRVKKKKKFEEKKKKLASIKPVYKGGEGRGGYGGELTGIKKGLVKSTKL